jgi:hypothetical protein
VNVNRVAISGRYQPLRHIAIIGKPNELSQRRKQLREARCHVEAGRRRLRRSANYGRSDFRQPVGYGRSCAQQYE